MLTQLVVDKGVGHCVLDGELTYEVVWELKDRMEDILNRSKDGLIIDATKVGYMDSMGLSMLMRCHAHMLRSGRKFVLVLESGPVVQLLQTVAVDSILTTAQSIDEANELLASPE